MSSDMGSRPVILIQKYKIQLF